MQIRWRVQSRDESKKCVSEAFALACEACRRSVNLSPYLVQVRGGLALYGGAIAEMQTGDPSDGRAWLICITTKGRRTFKQVRNKTEGFRELLLSHLDEFERDSLLQSLHKVAAAMIDDGSQPVMNGKATKGKLE